MKAQTYYEQPVVLFRNVLLLEVLDDEGVSRQFSTVNGINNQLMNPLSMPTIKMSRKDSNHDGRLDVYDLQISFKQNPSKVRQIQVMGSFDYALSSKVKLQMVGMLDLVADTPNGASKVIADGSLVFKQKEPVLIDS